MRKKNKLNHLHVSFSVVMILIEVNFQNGYCQNVKNFFYDNNTKHNTTTKNWTQLLKVSPIKSKSNLE